MNNTYRIALLAWQRALSEFRSQHMVSVLGVFWSILTPLFLIAIFSIVFSQIMGQRLPHNQGKLSYTFFLCAGFFPWLAFYEIVSNSCQTLQRNAGYMRKMPVSELTFFLQSAFSALIVLTFSFGVFLVIAILGGIQPAMTWVYIPLVCLVMIYFGLALGIIVGLINVYIRDAVMMVPIALQLTMWMTPIIYPISVIPEQFRFVSAMSPLTPIVNMLRDVTLYASSPSLSDITSTMIWMFVLTYLAGLTWKKLIVHVRDYL